MTDRIELLQSTRIQHGSHSNRVYLMKLADGDVPAILPRLDALVRENEYTKIFAKVPARHEPVFLDHGYRREAFVPGYYGDDACAMMARYFSAEREQAPDMQKITAVLKACAERKTPSQRALPSGTVLRMCTPDDAHDMAQLYRQVFASYPFPIHRSDYLRETMAENIHYFGIWEKDRLVAMASSETDPDAGAVEMTDFATAPDRRGNGFASLLLAAMAPAMRERGFHTAFTIARAVSYGMNFTFCDAGYEYGGLLINNTHIGGRLESMNVWHRPLES